MYVDKWIKSVSVTVERMRVGTYTHMLSRKRKTVNMLSTAQTTIALVKTCLSTQFTYHKKKSDKLYKIYKEAKHAKEDQV